MSSSAHESSAVRAGKLAHLRDARKTFREGKRVLVEEEKDFPLTKYFIGGKTPEKPNFKPNWREWKNDRITATWIGHATALVNFFGTWILTDPVFSERVGPRPLGFTIGPRRLVEPPLDIKDLPPIDLIVVSHGHLDHTDMPTLSKLRKAKHVRVAMNTIDIYQHLKWKDCKQMDWGETDYIEDIDTLVEAIQVKHFGWRFPWEPCRGRNEKNGRSFNAFYIEKKDPEGNKRSILFGGDTAYTESFKALGDRLRAEQREIDVAIFPIGAYNPWIGAHCNPEMAWQMVREANARAILPVHWNTFIQSAEPRFEPIEWLRNIVDDPRQIVLSEIGETWSVR